MKINSAISSVGGASEGGRSRTTNGAAKQPAAPSGEQVELSPLSARLQEIESSVASAPAVNTQRVAEIRQAISEGRFKVDPERIADGLLDSVRQMLGNNSRRSA